MICQHFFAETPTFFALSYFGLYLDYRYPLGGRVSSRKTHGAFCSACGTVRLGTAVTRSFRSKQAELSDGTRGSTTLIWAANQRSLYEGLNEPLPKKAEAQKRLAAESQGMDSVLTLFRGVSGAPETVAARCGAHAFYTPDTAGLSTLPHWRTLACDGEEAVQNWLVSYLERSTLSFPLPPWGSPLRRKARPLVVSTLSTTRCQWYLDAGSTILSSALYEYHLRVLEQSVFPTHERVEFSLALLLSPSSAKRATTKAQSPAGRLRTSRPPRSAILKRSPARWKRQFRMFCSAATGRSARRVSRSPS